MMFGEYIPFYEQHPLVHEALPRGVELQPRQRPGGLPARSTAAGDFKLGPLICYEDILPSFARRVATLRPEPVRQHHQRRLVRPHRRAVPAPGAGGVPLRRAPAGDGARGQHRRVGAHRRRRARACARAGPSIRSPTRSRRRPRCWSTLALLDGGGLYRYVGDLFGFLCLAALVILLWRARPAAPAAPAPARAQRRKKKG